MIIGLSGYARSGKDSIADILVENHGFRKVAFADKLRESLYALNPLVYIDVEFDTTTDSQGEFLFEESWERPIYVQDVIDEFGWEGYKETQYHDEIRLLAQHMGTEVGREILGEDIWVNALFDNLDPDWKNLVITDMRFQNEVRAIRSRGGYAWRVERPGIKPAGDHPSEISLDDWAFDAVIQNDGNLKDLALKVDQVWRIHSNVIQLNDEI